MLHMNDTDNAGVMLEKFRKLPRVGSQEQDERNWRVETQAERMGVETMNVTPRRGDRGRSAEPTAAATEGGQDQEGGGTYVTGNFGNTDVTHDGVGHGHWGLAPAPAAQTGGESCGPGIRRCGVCLAVRDHSAGRTSTRTRRGGGRPHREQGRQPAGKVAAGHVAVAARPRPAIASAPGQGSANLASSSHPDEPPVIGS